MAVREILPDTDPKLRKISRHVKEIDQRVVTLLEDMAQTMAEFEGVGLAAPQIGILKRIAVVDAGDGILELINPVVTFSQGVQMINEGCLSVKSGQRGYVKRPAKIVVEAHNRDGELMEYEAEGLTAIALSHEIDHLDGIIFTDKLETLTEEEIVAIEAYNDERFGIDRDYLDEENDQDSGESEEA